MAIIAIGSLRHRFPNHLGGCGKGRPQRAFPSRSPCWLFDFSNRPINDVNAVRCDSFAKPDVSFTVLGIWSCDADGASDLGGRVWLRPSETHPGRGRNGGCRARRSDGTGRSDRKRFGRNHLACLRRWITGSRGNTGSGRRRCDRCWFGRGLEWRILLRRLSVRIHLGCSPTGNTTLYLRVRIDLLLAGEPGLRIHLRRRSLLRWKLWVRRIWNMSVRDDLCVGDATRLAAGNDRPVRPSRDGRRCVRRCCRGRPAD